MRALRPVRRHGAPVCSCHPDKSTWRRRAVRRGPSGCPLRSGRRVAHERWLGRRCAESRERKELAASRTGSDVSQTRNCVGTAAAAWHGRQHPARAATLPGKTAWRCERTQICPRANRRRGCRPELSKGSIFCRPTSMPCVLTCAAMNCGQLSLRYCGAYLSLRSSSQSEGRERGAFGCSLRTRVCRAIGVSRRPGAGS